MGLQRIARIFIIITCVLVLDGYAKLCPSRCFCRKDLSTVNCSGKKYTSFPNKIPTTVQSLYMDHNLLTTIPVGPLNNLSSLTLLDLRNNVITSIEPNAFLGCGQLQELYLVTNKFTQIAKGAFNGATSLSYLSLSANYLTRIPSLGPLTSLQSLVIEGNRISNATFPKEFRNLKMINDIILSNNPIGTLYNNTFENLQFSPVKKLEIARSQISKVGLMTFTYLKTISSLKIGYNPINEWQLINIMTGLKNSEIVSLDIRNITLNGKLPNQTFALMKHIRYLSLRSNRIQTIQKMAFAGLPLLVSIDLSSCQIMTIEEGAFFNLTSLQLLLLNGNKLTSVPRGLPSTLHILHMEKNDITTISNGVFRNLSSLTELYINDNKIHVLQENSFTGLRVLSKLHLNGNRIATLPGDVFNSLVRLETLSLNQNVLKMIPVHPGRFSGLVSLIYLGLNDNQCSSLPLDLFKPLDSLMYLDLANNTLGQVIREDLNGDLFASLSKLERIDLEGNQISVMPDPVFKNLVSLTNLSLAKNQISHWGENLFGSMTQLHNLDLSDNLITLVNQTSLKRLDNLKVLKLRGSPFECSCDMRWFRAWTNTTSVSLPGLTSWNCESPAQWQGKPFLSFDASKINCEDYTLYYILSGVAGGMIISVLISLILYRYRWFISFRFYRCCRFFKTDKAGRRGYNVIPGDDKIYDVFISCAEEDRKWVVDKLLPHIDIRMDGEGKFRTCYSERDFEPQRPVVHNIVQSLESSRQAFIILSKCYCQCSRCEFELETILNADAEGDIDSFTIVKVGKLPVKYVPKSLSKYIEKHKYIEYPNVHNAESDFIEKLCDVLDDRNIQGDAMA